jgi:formylmethanofuran dehydrogenase subunit E
VRKTNADYVAPDVVDDEEAASNAYADICDDAVERARTKAAKIEPGEPGECSYCGEPSPRVVIRNDQFACAPCRDKYKLG